MKNIHATMTRRNFIHFSGFAGAGIATLGILSGCSNSSDNTAASGDSYTLVEDGKLTAIGDWSFPPLESMDENTGEVQGFDIDLLKAVAEKMGLEANFLPTQKFDTLVPTITQGGRADVAISGITITDERLEQIDFTDAYLSSNQGLVVKIGSQFDGLDEKALIEALNTPENQVSAQSGTTGGDWIQENLPNCTYVPLDDPIQSMTGVSSGLYSACVSDLPVVSNLCNESYTDLTVALQIPTGEEYGIVVSKDNPQLTAAINEALKELEEDGTMDELQTKWFGQTI